MSFQEFLILRFCITATPAKINCLGEGGIVLNGEKKITKNIQIKTQNASFCLQLKKGPWRVFFIFLFYYYFWCCNCLDCCVRFAVCWTNSVKTCQHGLIFRMTLFHQSGPFAVSKFLDVINHQVYKKNLLARKR